METKGYISLITKWYVTEILMVDFTPARSFQSSSADVMAKIYSRTSTNERLPIRNFLLTKRLFVEIMFRITKECSSYETPKIKISKSALPTTSVLPFTADFVQRFYLRNFRLTKRLPERINFVSRGSTVHPLIFTKNRIKFTEKE